MQPRHLRGGTSLVDEHECFGIKIMLPPHPLLTRRRYIGPLLFSRMRRLYGMARPFSPASDMMPVL
jgi:hypothetical protein